ncbi:hypothetical protein BDW59DRAFT_168163, partial [Aspergillus cavernicola]
MENQLFENIPSLRVILCCQCQHGVRPAEVEQHLKQKHQFTHQPATLIAEAVHQWEDIEQASKGIQIPRVLNMPLPILPCQTNGLLCQRDPECQYLVCNMDTMRKHWREIHHWSQHTRRGRVGPREKAQGEAELARSFTQVSWQQVFPSGKGSHYIHIQYPNGHQSPSLLAGHTAQVVDHIITTWEQAQAARDQQA